MTVTLIRPRRDADLPRCVEALADVHDTDRYPANWPADPRGWLTPREMLGAWVAADGPSILGHVALGRTSPELAGAIGAPTGLLATVARLFVRLPARGRGLAVDLLSVATRAATADGLQPALEVESDATAAITLHERAGWRFVRTMTANWTTADGRPVLVRAYTIPASGP